MLTNEYIQTVNQYLNGNIKVPDHGMYIPIYQQQSFFGVPDKPIVVVNASGACSKIEVAGILVHEMIHYIQEKKYLIVNTAGFDFRDLDVEVSDIELMKMISKRFKVYAEANAVYWQEQFYRCIDSEESRLLLDSRLTHYVDFIKSGNLNDEEQIMYALGIYRFCEDYTEEVEHDKYNILQKYFCNMEDFYDLFEYSYWLKSVKELISK